jgi:N-acetylneuraminate synthase
MSANHNGSIDTARRIIDRAAECGADALKIQTYRADTLTIDSNKPDFKIEEGLWKGKTLYELYEWAHTPWDWHHSLFEHAGKRGITIFSSPFDATAVDLLEDLNAPAYKIASFEAIDLELIRYTASTGKPLIISTGMADVEEIGEAAQAARDAGCRQLALLHCVSGYPAPASDYNLQVIPDMAERFGCVVGLSDHTLDNTTAIAAVAMGAKIIEKHFTLDRQGGGPDDSFSLEPTNLQALCRDSRTAWEAMGKIDYGRKSSECGNVKFRRSLYCVKDIRSGECLTREHVRSIRPGYGLAPKHLKKLIGMTVKKDITAGTPLNWDQIKKD